MANFFIQIVRDEVETTFTGLKVEHKGVVREQKIEAARVDIIGGAVVFYDDKGEVLRALGVGCWQDLERVKERVKPTPTPPPPTTPPGP